jgi:CubicO group peptidase (beta-lactamase class C family)
MNGKLLLIALCLLFSATVYGQDSGTLSPGPYTAFSYPVKKIIVDGDTSDWPKDAIKIPLLHTFGRKPASSRDLSGYFKTGYNQAESSLYFVAVITDDSQVYDTSTSARAETQDTYCLYLDSKNMPSGSGVTSYMFNDKWRGNPDSKESWDPDVRKAGWDNVQTACKHYGTITVYELRIILKDQIFTGKSLGIDQMIVDKDADDGKNECSFLSWGDRTDKGYSPFRLCYLILTNAKTPSGTLTGNLRWEDVKIGKLPDRIMVTSIKNPALLVQVPVDTNGAYSAVLPVGSYEIIPSWNFQRTGNDMYRIDRNLSKVTAQIRPDTKVVAPQLVLKTVAAPDLIPEKGIMFDFDDSKAALLDNFVKAYQVYYIIPGVSLAMIKDGKVIYHKTYGVKNAYTREPVDDNTLFEAASITKTVFAFAVNSLAEKGIIDLDKPLWQYLPFEELADDDRYKLMTARHVLSHQTGLPNWAYNEPDGKIRLKFTPGTGYGYSGEGFEYLKRVVVKITGKDIETVLNEEVLQPLGLHNFYFSKNDYLAGVVANGHNENYPTRSDLPSSPGMAWSMYTEAEAFSKYVIALQNHEVLKPETYKAMFSIQSTVQLDEEDKKKGMEAYYGLGYAIEKTPFGYTFEHGGNNGDFQCQFMMFPDLNMGFVIFTNSDSGGKLAYYDLRRFLITGKGNGR